MYVSKALHSLGYKLFDDDKVVDPPLTGTALGVVNEYFSQVYGSVIS